MITEIGDTIEFLGRFATFWAFVLKPTFRRAAIGKWQRGTRLARFLGVADGALTAVVGLFPVAMLGTCIWLLA